MPPDGYTTVTINEETVAKLARIMASHDVDSMSLAIDHAAQTALDEKNDEYGTRTTPVPPPTN